MKIRCSKKNLRELHRLHPFKNHRILWWIIFYEFLINKKNHKKNAVGETKNKKINETRMHAKATRAASVLQAVLLQK